MVEARSDRCPSPSAPCPLLCAHCSWRADASAAPWTSPEYSPAKMARLRDAERGTWGVERGARSSLVPRSVSRSVVLALGFVGIILPAAVAVADVREEREQVVALHGRLHLRLHGFDCL